MTELSERLTALSSSADKVVRIFEKRVENAQRRMSDRVKKAHEDYNGTLMKMPTELGNFGTEWIQYTTDCAQRWILFWDTLRKRGNNFIEHELAGKPPVLHFRYNMIMDARTFERPANYALLEILPPAGVEVNPKRRPYIIIDPRAGHGPGIGGFKDDSEAGVAMRAGHPVYFIMFFPKPVPGQTLLDVCAAERTFVKAVRERHPHSSKPVIIGNCQGGWAAMMVAASDPDNVGALVINGAPMSYWSGSWSEGESENPMRYSGGLLGGSWTASLLADLGNGVFDGAHLVQNFENLNPANTFWDKYYHLFSHIDTEPERFLDFERWWGGYSLMNKEEIEWIVQNLFVGNKVWSASGKELGGMGFDLRDIKSPVILFASMGDNITPPQQAFNWIMDTYHSTDEIKARGQVIIGLLHKSIGHLGIFVSGKVAKKEHTEIVSVLKSIEMLPPGLYGMHIVERKGADGRPQYEVEFEEHRLEEIADRVNRFKRADERPFQAVEEVSEFNQRAYDLLAHPFVKNWSNGFTAMMGRIFHPMRFQRWAISDMNPWLAWLGPLAEMVEDHRQAMDEDTLPREREQLFSELVSASLDYFRDIRDAAGEAIFFQTYGSMPQKDAEERAKIAADQSKSRLRADVSHARISEGGYAEALSRVGYLLSAKNRRLPLAQIELKKQLAARYGKLLPHLSPEQVRVIRGKQEVICRDQPQEAVNTLPLLLSDPSDRDKFFIIVNAVVEDYSKTFGMSREQSAMLNRIREVLSYERIPVAS